MVVKINFAFVGNHYNLAPATATATGVVGVVYLKHLRAVVCKIRAILKRRCHTISPNWLKIGM